MVKVVLAIMPAVFASVLPAAGAESASTEATIMALENAAMERWRQGDPMGWAEISAPEVTYVDPGLTKPIVGIEAYTRYLEGIKGKVFYEGSEFLHPKVAVYGDVAVLTYNYRSTRKNSDGSVAWRNLWNTTEIYARLNGAWKIVHTHWSYVGHTSPEAIELPLPVENKSTVYGGVLGEVMALEMKAIERWRKGDPFGFTDISAGQVTYFDSGTPARMDGLAALKAECAKRAGKIHYDAADFVGPSVQVHGNTAILLYRFFDTFLRPDGSVRQRIAWNCTEIYARQSGAWKIVHTHWSLIGGRPKGPSAD